MELKETKGSRSMHEFKGKRVKIITTSGCNLKCNHCYVNYQGHRNYREVQSMIDSLKEKYELRLDGAELLTDFSYLPLMKKIGQDNFCSNGKIILEQPEKALSALKENDIKTMYLSYHYGIQTQLTDFSLADIEKAIKLLQEAGITVGLMCTLTKDNWTLLDELCDQAIRLGINYVQINRLILQGRARKNMKDVVITDDMLPAFFKVYYENRKKYSNSVYLECGKAFEYVENGSFHCRSVNSKVWIGLDNKVYPCVFLIQPGMEIGEYIDGKVMIYDNVNWGGKKCAAYMMCNNGIKLWGRACE